VLPLRWISFKEIAERHGEVYEWLCEDLISGYFEWVCNSIGAGRIRYVGDRAARITVTRLRRAFPHVHRRPDFISKYLDPWHVPWLVYERWRMDHKLPGTIGDTFTSPETPIVATDMSTTFMSPGAPGAATDMSGTVTSPETPIVAKRRNRGAYKRDAVLEAAQALWGTSTPSADISTPRAREQIRELLTEKYPHLEVDESTIDRAIGRKNS
jgi:hypothetical protein